MRWSKMVNVVAAHAEGETGRVITGGVAVPPGATMAEKMRYLDVAGDGLRRMCLFEPRGAA